MYLARSRVTLVLVLTELITLSHSRTLAGRRHRRKREHRTLAYSDCGTNSTVQFEYVSASPLPVHLPGTLTVTIKANVTDPLPTKLGITIRVYKYIFGIPVRIPCFYGRLGSCDYHDLCSMMYPAGQSCPAWLEEQALPCRCPIQPGHHKLADYQMYLPQVQSYAGFFARGEYSLRMRVVSEQTELGCLDLKFHVKQRRRRRYSRHHREQR